MLAHIEAFIDFEADEVNDLDPMVFKNLHDKAHEVIARIQRYLKQGEVAEAIREGFKIAIVGPPNAGKSTLMNLLAKRRVSIVSEVPGTTRDLVSTNLNLFGHHVILTDTAGIRSKTTDSIEHQGIEMAKEELEKSHGILFVLDIVADLVK